MCHCFLSTSLSTTQIYTLSLHDALPISPSAGRRPSHTAARSAHSTPRLAGSRAGATSSRHLRSEEHTSELQSRGHLVCRLLLEKKNDETLHPTSMSLPMTTQPQH